VNISMATTIPLWETHMPRPSKEVTIAQLKKELAEIGSDLAATKSKCESLGVALDNAKKETRQHQDANRQNDAARQKAEREVSSLRNEVKILKAAVFVFARGSAGQFGIE
jgi:chromosome segregation ATPase